MDFDKLKIAKAYSKSRNLTSAAVLTWQKEILKLVPRRGVRKILDLGCGTGNLIPLLRKTFPKAKIIGVDPARSMLAEAKKAHKGSGFKFLSGRAEQIPLADASVDLVFCSMMWHAIDSDILTIREIKRVLKPKGFLVIRQVTKEINHSLTVFRFFPEAERLSFKLVPRRKDMIFKIRSCGFRQVGIRLIRHPYAENYRKYYEKISQLGISVLRMLPKKIVRKDMGRLKEFCKVHTEIGPVLERRDLLVFQKP